MGSGEKVFRAGSKMQLVCLVRCYFDKLSAWSGDILIIHLLGHVIPSITKFALIIAIWSAWSGNILIIRLLGQAIPSVCKSVWSGNPTTRIPNSSSVRASQKSESRGATAFNNFILILIMKTSLKQI